MKNKLYEKQILLQKLADRPVCSPFAFRFSTLHPAQSKYIKQYKPIADSLIGRYMVFPFRSCWALPLSNPVQAPAAIANY